MGPNESMVCLHQPVWYPGARFSSACPCECPVPPSLPEQGSSVSVQVSGMQEGTAGREVAAVGTGILAHLCSPRVGWCLSGYRHELLI